MNDTYDIISPSGALIHSEPLNANCVRKFSLMSEDSVTVHFSLRDAVDFPIGSSIDNFFICREQTGMWNNLTGLWDYTLKFDAYYWLWANKILRYIIPGVDSAAETSFTLTATIDIHAAVIKNCLDYLGFTFDGSPFRIDTTATSLSLEPKLIRYENLSVLGGIQAIAEAFGCEWWVIGNAVYFGRCENKDSQFTFEAGVNTSSIQFSQGKEEIPNRIYIYGSSRNLPPGYRTSTGNDTIGGVVNRRLMLPDGTPYLQSVPGIPESQVVERVVVLDSIYPRLSLVVTEDPEEYTSDIDKEEEGGETTANTFYRIRYGDGFPFLSDYILPNEELHIVFESGLLNGMDFGAKFNPKGANEKNADGSINPDSQMIEIVANEDYGRTLPDSILRPAKGDKFFLYGWDSTKMADLGLIARAEQLLLSEGKKLLTEYTKDTSTCTCPMAWDFMKPLIKGNRQPKPGDSVIIMDAAHFGKGGRESRIIGYEYKLDKPYAECTYICGEKIAATRLNAIEQKIEGITKSGTKVQMQNSLDFLSKRYADRTPYSLSIGGKLSAEKGVEFGQFISGLYGGTGGAVDEKGNAEFESAVIRTALTVMELVINEQSVTQGDQIYTEGDTIDTVTPETDAAGDPVTNPDGSPRYIITIRPRHDGYITAIAPGMVIRGVVNNLFDATAPGAPSYYTSWMRVNGPELGTAGNRLSVTLYPDSEVPAAKNYPPCPLMTLARWGHQTIEEMQRLFRLSSREGTLVRYEGVTKPVIDLGNIASLIGRCPAGMFTDIPGVKEGDEIAYFKTVIGNFIQYSHKGKPRPTIIYTGQYDPSRTYKSEHWESDPVTGMSQFVSESCTYCGCMWLCCRDGVTGLSPGYGVTAWAFMSGDDTFRVGFEETQILYDVRQIATFGATLTLTASLRGQDVLGHIPRSNVTWSRVSYDRDGVLRAASDAAWVPVTDRDGKRLILSAKDLDFDGTVCSRIMFSVRVAIDDTSVHPAEAAMEFTL